MDPKKPEIIRYIGKDITYDLYHGSKGGLLGPIRPNSRPETDFGKGFYLGGRPEQPKTLICDHKRPVFYEMQLNLSGLQCVEVSGTTWAMLVAYNRGIMDDFKDTKLYEHMSEITKNCDIIIGPIADDKMYAVLNMFYDNLITDATLKNCMQALQLGDQYVAKTNKACSKKHIRIQSEHVLTPEERKEMQLQAVRNKQISDDLTSYYITQANRQKYKIGRIFQEILEEGETDAPEDVPNTTL